MSNVISVPFQDDELDRVVAEAEAKLKSSNGIGVVIGLMIGDEVTHSVINTDDCGEGLKAFNVYANNFMRFVNKRDLPVDFIVRTVGWKELDDALLQVLVNASFDFMEK